MWKFITGLTLILLILVFGATPVTESVLLKSVNEGRIGEIGLFRFHADSVKVDLLGLRANFKNIQIRVKDHKPLSADVEELVLYFHPIQWMKGVKDLKLVANKVNFYFSKQNFADLKVEKLKPSKPTKKRPELNLEIILNDVELYRTAAQEKAPSFLKAKKAEGIIYRELSATPLLIKGDIETNQSAHIKFKTKSDKGYFNFHGSIQELKAEEIEYAMGNHKKMPIRLEKGSLSANFNAQSKDGMLTGVITPKIEDLKLMEEKKQNFFKRIAIKVANKILKDQKEKKLTTTIPFTFKDSELDIDFQTVMEDLKIE